MNLSVHIITSAILATILYPFFGLSALLVIVSSFLIDFDHFIYFAFKFKNLNIFKTYRFYNVELKKRSIDSTKKILLVFHTIEFLLLIIILSFFSKVFFILLLGIVLHYILDIIYQVRRAGKIMIPISIIFWMIKHK